MADKPRSIKPISTSPVTTYEITPADLEAINARFSYHAPFGDQPARYAQLRAAAREYAVAIYQSIPPCMERDQAIMLLHLASMSANSGMACHEAPP